MKPKLLLRIASIVMLLHTVGHTLGALTWKQAPNDTIAKVVQGMEQNYFDFLGRQVSLGMLFQGYGVEMIFVLLLLVSILWLLGNFIENLLSQKLLPLLFFFLVCFAACEWIYFFPVPAIMSSIAALLVLIAYLGSKKKERM